MAAKGKLTPPFRSPLMTHIRDSRTEISERLALERQKVELTARRTALMERQVEQRAARPTREEKAMRPSADFAARRAEIDAILDSARAEIAEQLLELCERWHGMWHTPKGDPEMIARCCADVTKLAATLRPND